ncbi:CAP domain-containing protein [Cellulomonas timonensis]|uniref:CAP domain-containing protein n=1 Tax=Cellulomonas timonensis TaxID=1689271 RepID=UPI0008357B75|nr:hypothetical protein [Cellulomonas timonensis]
MATVRHKHQRRLETVPTQRQGSGLAQVSAPPVESRPASFVPPPQLEPLPPETAALLLPDLAGLFVPSAEPPAAPPQTDTSRPRRAARSAARPGRPTTVVVSLSVVVIIAAIAGGTVVRLQQESRAAELARVQDRVARVVSEQRADAQFFQQSRAAVARAGVASALAAQGDAALAAHAQAQAVLDANAQAGDVPRAALQEAMDTAAAKAAALGQGTSPVDVRGSVAALAAPQQAVVEAQAQWQAAEDARLEAERVAAAEAAAAAERKTRAASSKATPRSSRAAAPAAASAGAAAGAPAAAQVAGIEAYGIQSIGDALNAHRANNGLPALSISGSSTLSAHATAMASEWRIWHGGNDSIVGWVQPASSSAMINAYANSSSHNTWMLKSDISRMSIGAVVRDGRLFTAIKLS